ncbi:FAD-dependent oxidoreductase [Xanthomonas citri pv. mangiferaeindicae]|nr:FAD-dependent oxidoreductase [Xanthomonas citri pv. mangiferaeindicae]
MSTGITRPVWFDDLEPLADVFTEKNPGGEQDVVVVGAGIAGLTTAVQLAHAGRDVLIVERDDIGAGETLRTTAHLASALDDRFFNLARHHGEAGARLAAASHAAAIDWIEARVRDGIDCDFRRVPGYLFPHGSDVSDIEREFDAARQAGLEVERLPGLEALPDLGGPVLRFAGQARIDIGRYLQGLAEEARASGCRFHRAEVERVEGGARPTLTMDARTLHARAVVVATNVPFHPTGATFHKQAPYRSFVVAAEIAADAVPDGLYWDDADPYHYVRLHTRRDGSAMLIVGGADHKTGQGDDPEVYARLQAWARARFPGLGTFTHAWSGQVLEPADGLAFLGADPANENVYLITGDSGNGITHGTIGGLLIADLIQGRDNPWVDLYDPARKPIRSGGAWIRENANAASQFRDWIKPADVHSPDAIARGTGAVLRRGLHRVAVYRAGDDTLHVHNARCPHMGCVVRWSTEEKSWDCPCHGSRFEARTGAILNGPTDQPLAPCTLDGDPVER